MLGRHPHSRSEGQPGHGGASGSHRHSRQVAPTPVRSKADCVSVHRLLRTHVTSCLPRECLEQSCGHSGPQGTRAVAINFLPKELHLLLSSPHSTQDTLTGAPGLCGLPTRTACSSRGRESTPTTRSGYGTRTGAKRTRRGPRPQSCLQSAVFPRPDFLRRRRGEEPTRLLQRLQPARPSCFCRTRCVKTG